MFYLYIALTFLAYGLIQTLFMIGQKKGYVKSAVILSLYFIAAVLSIIGLAWQGQLSSDLFKESFFWVSVVIGLLISVSSIAGSYFMQIAFKKGPGSIAGSINALNAIIVIVVCLVFYNEFATLVPRQIIGASVAIIAAVLLRISDKEKSVKIQKFFWIFLIIAAASNGITNALFKIGAAEGGEKMLISAVLYLGATALAIPILKKEISVNEPNPLLLRQSYIWGLIIGICSFIGTISILKAFTLGPGTIVSAIVSVNVIILLMVTFIIYKEGKQLSRWQIIGIVIAIIAAFLMRF